MCMRVAASLFATRFVKYWNASSVCPCFPIRTPISAPCSFRTTQPSFLLMNFSMTTCISIALKTFCRNSFAASITASSTTNSRFGPSSAGALGRSAGASAPSSASIFSFTLASKAACVSSTAGRPSGSCTASAAAVTAASAAGSACAVSAAASFGVTRTRASRFPRPKIPFFGFSSTSTSTWSSARFNSASAAAVASSTVLPVFSIPI